MTAKAGFRFIPIEPGVVVAPPLPFTGISHSQPNASGSVSGTIKVTWMAETPVCIGGKVEDPKEKSPKVVTAVRFGNRFCLPGSTLRGMVRSVLEIATLSHLGRINAERHHGVRTWDKDFFPDKFGEVGNDLRAGWLTWSPAADGKTSKGTWILRSADTRIGREGYRAIHFKELLARINSSTTDTLGDSDWRGMTLSAKTDALVAAQLSLQQGFDDGGPYNANRPSGLQKALLVPAGRRGTYQGVIVCAGSDATDDPTRWKTHEAVFGPPSSQRWILKDKLIKLFHALHSDPGRNAREPRENWRWWLARMAYLNAFGIEPGKADPSVLPQMQRGFGIPVYYCGEPDAIGPDPSRVEFFLSLTRVPRYPWRYSVGETAQRLYSSNRLPTPYRLPPLASGTHWDFARAMFGDVEDETVHDLTRDENGQPTAAAALAGRVAFGPAFAVGTPASSKDNERTGVLGQPRESFHPFYLANNAGGGGNYEDSTSLPAGRKRYVARTATVALPQGNENEATMTTIRFLPKGSTFTGEIKFHNLHPVELGAVLWALTFGEPGGPHRHMIGRAKAFGYGLLKADIQIARHTVNRPPSDAGVNSELAARGGAQKPEGWIACFERYMRDRQPAAFNESVEQLRHLALPSTGAANRAALDFGELTDYQDWKRKYPGNARGKRSLLPELPRPARPHGRS